MEKSCPGKDGHLPSRVNFSERSYEKKVDPLMLEPTVLAHDLIVSPWRSWPGWASQSVYMGKSWPG